jgi:hypothetical protein
MRAGYQSHETAFAHAGTSTQVSDHSGRCGVNGPDRVVGHYGVYAQSDPVEELAQLYFFSFKKCQPTGEVEFVITVKEFASRNALQMRFYAQADKEVNQRIAPFRPFGWGIRYCARSANALTPSARTPTSQNRINKY